MTAPQTPDGGRAGVFGDGSMNHRLLVVAAAGVTLAGAGIVIVPQHAVSLIRLAAATVAAVAGALVLAAVAPHVSAVAPETALDRATRRRAETLDPHGLRDARRDLARPVQPDGVPVEVRDRLRRVAELRLARIGLDLGVADRDRAPISAQTWALLDGPSAASPARTASPARAAAAVHRVLDDLDTIDHPTGRAHGHR